MRWTSAAAVAAALLPAPLPAQLGDVQLGGLVSYGAADVYRGGAGLIAGVSAGRLIYAGVRWVYYFGAAVPETRSTGTITVTNRSQVYAADVGLQYPVGPLELIGGVTIGAIRFEQTTRPIPPGSGPVTNASHVEFLVTPTVCVQLRALDLMWIPELSYSLSSAPSLPLPVDRSGLLVGLRVVVPIEVKRIRR